MLVYGYLFNKINAMVDEIDHYSSRLVMLLKTGRTYFDNFSPDELITTQQDPKKKDKINEEKKDAA